MTKRKALLLLQSLICVLIVLMLAAAAVRICREGIAARAVDPGADIYTAEKIRAALLPVLPVFLCGMAVTAACAVLGIRDEQADKPAEDTEIARDLLCARVAEPTDEMKKETALQSRLLYGGWAAAAACMTPVLLYISDPDHFAESDAAGLDLTIRTMAAHVFPLVLAAFCILAAATVLMEKSMKREMELASQRIREEKEQGTAKAAVRKPLGVFPSDPVQLRNRRLTLLALAVVFIVAGILNGGMRDVLIKAINVCSECIGLG